MIKPGLILILLLVCQPVWADAAAEIKYRESVMEVVGGHMHAMVAILKGRVHAGDLDFHAQAMANVAKVVPSVFPAGSGKGKTEALQKIWDQPAEFKISLQKFVDAAESLANTTDKEDMRAVGQAIQSLGKSCKGCHDQFKAE